MRFQAERTFDLTVSIPQGNAAQIYDHLLRMKHITENPLVQSYRHVSEHEVEIVDLVSMFGFKMKVPYRGKVAVVDDHTLLFEGFQQMVYIQNVVSVTAASGHTLVAEHSTVRTFAPLLGFVTDQAKTAHEQMFNSLKSKFGA